MKHRRATNTRRFGCRALAATAGAVFASSLIAFPADAAEPANHACVGESLSALAGPGFGDGIVMFAQDGGPHRAHPGLGFGIQQLQVGNVADAVVPNTCNNP